MLEIRGRQYSPDEARRYFGTTQSLFGVREIELVDGPGRGCRMFEVSNGVFRFEVIPSRCLDIGAVFVGDTPVHYAGYAGIMHPAFFSAQGDAWLRQFGGGLLATCGLTTTGAPGVDGGEELPLHGHISNMPALWAQVDYAALEQGLVRITGQVQDAKALKHCLTLNRTITTRQGSTSLCIEDTITNELGESQEYELLYHINLGHPLIDAGSRLYTASSVEPRDELAACQEEPYDHYVAPTPGYGDVVYYHTPHKDEDGRGSALVVNEQASLALHLEFWGEHLDCLTQWKFLNEKNYVAGIEPGTSFVSGRAKERELGRLPVLMPHQRMTSTVKLTVLTSADAIEVCRRKFDRA